MNTEKNSRVSKMFKRNLDHSSPNIYVFIEIVVFKTDMYTYTLENQKKKAFLSKKNNILAKSQHPNEYIYIPWL